jgi:hypothetical protein
VKPSFNILLLALVWGVAGCVNTVTENQPGIQPAYRDRVEVQYQKPVEVVFTAAKRALTSFGNVTSEGQVFVGTNQVRVAEGVINGRLIYLRVEEINPQVTAAVVQVRTKMGGTDLRIATDLARRIGVELE